VLGKLPKDKALEVLERLTKLEKKAFPAYEAFLFDAKLLKLQNATVMFLTQTQTDFFKFYLSLRSLCEISSDDAIAKAMCS
jgi:hypothetical protein